MAIFSLLSSVKGKKWIHVSKDLDPKSWVGRSRYVYESDFDVVENMSIEEIEMNPERNKESKICYSKNKEDEGKSVSEIFGEYFPTSLLWDQCKECGINEGLDA